MNDAHRLFIVQVSLSAELVARVDERAKTLGITVDEFIARAIEGAIPSGEVVKPTSATPWRKGKRK